MTFNCLIEKYKILHSEENLINDYLYQNPEKLKLNKSTKIKKPKLYQKNKYIENFESYKSGSKKVLHEFQHLFIHKFLMNENQKQNEMKKSINTFDIKHKIMPNFRMFNANNAIPKIEKEDTYNSLLKIIKNSVINEDKPRRPQSRTQSRIIRLYPQTSSRSLRKSLFNITEKNKYITYQQLKQEEKFLSSSIESSQKNSVKLFQEKSKLSLLKQISSKIIQDKMSQALKLSSKNKNQSNCNSITIKDKRIKSAMKLEENKNFFNTYNINNNYNSRNMKYVELSKKGCNLSDAMIIRKKYFINSAIKERKIGKKLITKNNNIIKRPMSSLERYFYRYGAFQ